MANHAEKTLHLKAFAGIPTDHEVIPFGKGICGQVAVSNENFLVDDVSAQDNYIACDIHVKSEIVISAFFKRNKHRTNRYRFKQNQSVYRKRREISRTTQYGYRRKIILITST